MKLKAYIKYLQNIQEVAGDLPVYIAEQYGVPTVLIEHAAATPLVQKSQHGTYVLLVSNGPMRCGCGEDMATDYSSHEK